MRIALLEKPFVLTVKEVDDPVPGPGEVLLRVQSAGICGSDLHPYRGEASRYYSPPVVLGHEFAGTVEKVGAEVSSIAPGTRATIMPLKSCGECYYCRRGLPHLCDERVLLGTRAWPGAFADYVLAPANLVRPLGDEVSYDVGALVEPLTVGVHAARRGGIGLGDSVLVIGSGTIGLCAVIAAKAAGATTVIASDVSEFNLRKAREVGATETIDARSGDVVALARGLTGGRGVDQVLLAVDAPGVLQQAIGAARNRGTIVLIAYFGEPVTVSLTPSRQAEQTLVGCSIYDDVALDAALALAASRRTELEALITHHFELSDVARAFELGDRRTEDVVKIIVRP